MAATDRRAEDRQALEHLLEVYGADRTRWPARDRLRFASFVSEDESAARLLAEAVALNSLLDLAPRASEDRERALKERIVAAALRSGEPRLAVVAGSSMGSAAPARASRMPSWLNKARSGREWPAAVLAASLVVGVMLGSVGTFESTVQEVAEAAGLATAADTSQLALGDDIVASPDEDLL